MENGHPTSTDSSTIKNGKVVWTAYLTPEEYDFINLMVKGSCMTKEKFFVLASYFYIALNNNLKWCGFGINQIILRPFDFTDTR